MLSTATQALSVPKRLLYGPGPSMAEPRALAAMSLPVLGIRDPEFLRIMGEVRSGLRKVFGTSNPMTLTIPASGSGAMEATVVNFIKPGMKVGVFAAGHFADRFAIIAARYGANVVRCDKAWGEVFTESEAAEFIERERPDVVEFVQAETSTGAFQSGKPIAAAAREHGAMVVADTVTSLGAMPVELDEVGIDVAFSCSQKGLSCPAGLSPMSVSPRAAEWLDKQTAEPAGWYLDLKLINKYVEPPHVYHHTPSPPLYYAMHEALAIIEEEGLQARLERHKRAGERLTSGLTKLGFRALVENPENRIWHLTTVVPPPGVDEAALRQRLFDSYDIEVHPGLGQLAGKILRIGTMGPLATDESVDYFLHAMGASTVGRDMSSDFVVQLGLAQIQLLKGDITKIAVDAIVNAANSQLAGGGGVDGAIHRAGGPEIMRELDQIRSEIERCSTGSAVVTGAGRLPASFVFHAVGPRYRDGKHEEAALLASCYRSCLQLAAERDVKTISFPSISTGIYGFPIEEAAEIGLRTVANWLAEHTEPVRIVKLVQYSDSDHEVYRRRAQKLRSNSAAAS